MSNVSHKVPLNKNVLYSFLTTILLVFFLTTTCCMMNINPPTSVVPNIDTAYKSTWDVMNPLETRSIGAATVIRWEPKQKILALSAWHLFVNKPGPIFNLRYCRSSDETICVTKSVFIFRKDEVNDLVLLMGTKQEVVQGPSALVAKKEPLLGETVYIIGAPLQHSKLITRGVLSFIEQKDNKRRYLTDAAVIFGNSGGGLFNQQGELLGVVTERRRMPIVVGPFVTFGSAIPGFNKASSLLHIHKILQ